MHTVGKPVAAKGAVKYFKEDFAEKKNSASDSQESGSYSSDEESVFGDEGGEESEGESSSSASPEVAVENSRNSFRATRTMTQWHGKLAEKFGLEGAVTKKDFALLCEGIHPETGERLIRHVKSRTGTRKNGKTFQTISHRAGLDQSLNAPKSFSLVATKDERVIAAHWQSALKTTAEIEKFTRAKLGNTKPSQLTGESLYAAFLHDMARPDEITGFAAPDLHSHHFQINVVFDEQGKPHALETREVYACQRLATAVYRAEMVKGMKSLGYETEFNEETGAPEVVGISREYIDACSPRQKQVKETANKLGIKSTKIVAAGYRKGKNFDREEMLRRHQEIEDKFGNQAESAAREARKRTVEIKLHEAAVTPQEREAEAISNALKAGAAAELAIAKARENKDAEKLKDRKVTWQTLITDTINFARLEITIDEVKTELFERHKNGELEEFNLDRREIKNKPIQKKSAKEQADEEKYDEQRTLGSENQGIAREGQTSREKPVEESGGSAGEPFAGTKVGQDSGVGVNNLRASPIAGVVKTEFADQLNNDAGSGATDAELSGAERSNDGYSIVNHAETEPAELGSEQLAGGGRQLTDAVQSNSKFTDRSAGERRAVESPENGRFEFAGSNNSADPEFGNIRIAEEFDENRTGTINTTAGTGNGGRSGSETEGEKSAEPNELDEAARINKIRASENGKSNSFIDWRAEAESEQLVRTVESNVDDSGNQAADSALNSAADSGYSKSANDFYENGDAGGKDRDRSRQPSRAAQSFERAAEAPVAEEVERAAEQQIGNAAEVPQDCIAPIGGASKTVASESNEEREFAGARLTALESDSKDIQSDGYRLSAGLFESELSDAELSIADEADADGNLQAVPNRDAAGRENDGNFKSIENSERVQNASTESNDAGQSKIMFSADAELVGGYQPDAGSGAQTGNTEREVIIPPKPAAESTTAVLPAESSLAAAGDDGRDAPYALDGSGGADGAIGAPELIPQPLAAAPINSFDGSDDAELAGRALLPAAQMGSSFQFAADRFVPQILQAHLDGDGVVRVEPNDFNNQSALEVFASDDAMAGAVRSADWQSGDGINPAEILAQFAIKSLDTETKENLYKIYSAPLDEHLAEISMSAPNLEIGAVAPSAPTPEVQTMTLLSAAVNNELGALIRKAPELPPVYTISEPAMEMSQREKDSMRRAADALAQSNRIDALTEADIKSQTEFENEQTAEIHEEHFLIDEGLKL